MAKENKKAALSMEERLDAALVPDWEQPYKVPANWCWTKMDSVAQWGSGGTPSRRNPDYYGGQIPWVKTGELNDDYIYETEETITEEGLKCSSAKLYPINTIIIAMYGATVGKVGILGVGATTNQACACGVCSSAVNYQYLFYYAWSQKAIFIDLARGGAQPNISQEIIKNHPIPIPPLAEQQRIVDRIESLFAKLDEAKEKAQEVVDGYDARRAAILHKAFTGELTAEWRKSKNTSLESWLTQTLKDSCSIGSGGTPSRKNPEYFDGLIPWIKTGEIDWNEICDSEEHISQSAIDNSSAKLYPIGAVLVAMYGMGATRGRAAILNVDATTNQAVCVLQPKDYLVNRFLFYYFMCNYWDVREKAVGGNQLNLSATIIAKFVIRIPTIDEQKEIIRILDSLLLKEQQAKETAEQVIDQIDTMKKSILARAFRGELGTNDPNDESAEELLKRVL